MMPGTGQATKGLRIRTNLELQHSEMEIGL